MLPVLVAAQEANISTTVASLGSGAVATRISFDAVKPKPAAQRGLVGRVNSADPVPPWSVLHQRAKKAAEAASR